SVQCGGAGARRQPDAGRARRRGASRHGPGRRARCRPGRSGAGRHRGGDAGADAGKLKPRLRPPWPGTMTWRADAADLLGQHETQRFGRLAINTVILLAVVVSVGAAMADTLPDLTDIGHHLARVLQSLAAAVFAAEYLVRLWVAPEERPDAGHPWL